MKAEVRAQQSKALSAMQEQVDKYVYARANAPHPELEAYEQVLRSNASAGMAPANGGGDQVLASGPCPNGGVEMLVRKSDGVVVLLMPDLPQVKNTPQGPRQVKTQVPLELPLVRRTVQSGVTMRLNALWGHPNVALLLFQGRFSTAAREIVL